MHSQAKVIAPAMMVSCLHTIEANIEIFEAACPPDITLMHHVRADLMNRSLDHDHLGVIEETAMQLCRLQTISDAVVLTSSLLREAAVPPFYASDTVLHDAVLRAAPGKTVDILVASPRVLLKTQDLFTDLPDAEGLTFTLVADAWDAFQAGDRATFHSLIAQQIEGSDAQIVVLAQTLMTPAAGRDPRVITGPGVTLRTVLENHPR